MSLNSPGNPRKYVGENRTLIPFVTRPRRPTSADYRQPETGNYYIYGSVWQVGKDPSTGVYGELWMLQKIVANEGYWVMISTGVPPGGPVLSISDTANTLVFPTVGGNIQLEAGAGISIVSDAINNKLVVSSSSGGVSVDTFTTNVSGPVVATALGVVNVNASTSTYTDGSVANTLKTEVQATNYALKVGRGANTPMADLAVGVTHSILMGTTGADPGFTTTGNPYVSSISFDAGTNVLSRYNNTTTFTPSVVGSTTAGTATYVYQHGRYSRIGNMVFVHVVLEWTGHTGTGNMLVNGFPFIFASAASFYPMAVLIQNIVLPVGAKNVISNGFNNTTQMQIVCSIDNAPLSEVAMDADGSISFMGMYLTDP